jgi:hypothetical protein
MDPRCKDDCLPKGNVLGLRCEVRYNDHFTVITCESLAKHGFSHPFFIPISAESLQMFTTVAISEGVAMSKEDLILVVLEEYLEGQGVVKASSFLL